MKKISKKKVNHYLDSVDECTRFIRGYSVHFDDGDLIEACLKSSLAQIRAARGLLCNPKVKIKKS